MIERDIKALLKKGEGINLEHKSTFNAEVIESLVAFANTVGGSVIIGISNDLNVTGVTINAESVQNWINEIKSKTLPSIIPDVEIVEIGHKTVVILTIPEFPIKPVSFKGKYFKRLVNSNHLIST